MPITDIVWHYTATYEDQDIGAAEIDQMHRARGWSGIGYHHVIRLDGTIEAGRSPETKTGAHVGGQNTGKIGAVTVGGLRRATGPDKGFDTRTPAQIESQIKLTRDCLSRHPHANVGGHMDYAATQCPGYDVTAWWDSVNGHPRAPAPTPDAPTVSYPMIRRGSRGQAVRALQTALAAMSFPVGPVDGIFGPRTDSSVRSFQRAAGIDVDGIVGPITWTSIYSLLKGD